MEFFDDFFKWVQELCKERLNLVVVGDYNIVYNELDIYDLVCNKKIFGFLFEEWAWMDKWLESGFVDVFCYLNFGKEEYSWWIYCVNVCVNNKGWWLDYYFVSNVFVFRFEVCY